MLVLPGPSSVTGWRRTPRAGCLQQPQGDEVAGAPALHSCLVPPSGLGLGLLMGCACPHFAPSLRLPGLQASRPPSCPDGWSSLPLASPFSLWAPPLCLLLRPCCLLSSAASPRNQGGSAGPQRPGELLPQDLAPSAELQASHTSKDGLLALRGLFSRGKMPGRHQKA